MEIWCRVVLSALIGIFQLLAWMWACGNISILWVVVSLSAIYIIWANNTLNNDWKISLLRNICVTFSLITMSVICYLYPYSESWNFLCACDFLMVTNLKRIIETIVKELLIYFRFFCRFAQIIWNKLRPHPLQFVKSLIGFVVLIALVLYCVDWICAQGISLTNSVLEKGVKHGNILDRYIGNSFVTVEVKHGYGHAKLYIRGCAKTIAFRQFNLTSFNSYHSQVYKRYNGEDVELKCIFESNLEAAIDIKHYWTLNGLSIPKSEKKTSDIKKTAIGYNSVQTFMTLTISYIDDMDYGVYGCVEQLAYSVYFDQSVHVKGTDTWSSHGERVETVVKEEIQLKKIDTFVQVVHLSQADSAYFLGHEFLTYDESQVSYHYTVNGDPYDLSLPVRHQCSKTNLLLNVLYRFLMDPYLLVSYSDLAYINGIERDNKFQGISRHMVGIRFCSQPKAIGWHKLSYLREEFDSKTNKTKLTEFPHPIVRLVLPIPRRSVLFYNLDDTELYQQMESDILAKGHHEGIDELHLAFYRSNEQKVRYLDDNFAFVLFLGVLMVLSLTPYIFCRLIYMWIVKVPLLNNRDTRNVSNAESQSYDVFIAHSEEDYPWVVEFIVSYLEEELGLTVCLPDRDFHQANLLISATNQAINNSKIMLLILTDSYMNDPNCYNLQVERLLLPSLYQNERSDNSVVVLNCMECATPHLLGWNFDVNKIQWMFYPNGERLNVLKRKIKQILMVWPEGN